VQPSIGDKAAMKRLSDDSRMIQCTSPANFWSNGAAFHHINTPTNEWKVTFPFSSLGNVFQI